MNCSGDEVWLVSPYGPTPSESWRPYRFAILGRELAARGHQVVWWTSNYSHHFKRFRSASWHDEAVNSHFRVRFVPALAYAGNISLRRVASELAFSLNFYRRARLGDRPACIVATDPSQFVGFAAARLARRLSCPLVLDVMDLWPELFAIAVPRVLRPLARVFFAPLSAMRTSNLRAADCVTTLCETYLEHLLKLDPSLRSTPRLVAFNGIDVAEFRARLKTARPSCLPPGEGRTWAVYAGSLGPNYDIGTLIAAAQILAAAQSSAGLVIAGSGPLASAVARAADQRPNHLVFLGALPPGQLEAVYSGCQIGICAYGRGSNVAMPDKIYDYMAAGLPVLNSLSGELARLLEKRAFGLPYQAGDAKSLAAAIEHLAAHPALLIAMQERAHSTASDFDQKTHYSRLTDFVEAAFSSTRDSVAV